MFQTINMIYNFFNNDVKYHNTNVFENDGKSLEIFLKCQEEKGFELIECNEHSTITFKRKTDKRQNNRYHVQQLKQIYIYEENQNYETEELFIDQYKKILLELGYEYIGKTQHNYIFKKQMPISSSYYETTPSIEETVGSYRGVKVKTLKKSINRSIGVGVLTVLFLLFINWIFLDYSHASDILNQENIKGNSLSFLIISLLIILLYIPYLFFLLYEKRKLNKDVSLYFESKYKKPHHLLRLKSIDLIFAVMMIFISIFPLIEKYIIHITLAMTFLIVLTIGLIKFSQKYIPDNGVWSNVKKVSTLITVSVVSILVFINVLPFIVEPYDLFTAYIHQQCSIDISHTIKTDVIENKKNDTGFGGNDDYLSFYEMSFISPICPLYYRDFLSIDKTKLQKDSPYYILFSDDDHQITKKTYYFYNTIIADKNIDQYISEKENGYHLLITEFDDDKMILQETYYFLNRAMEEKVIEDYIKHADNKDQVVITQLDYDEPLTTYYDQLTILRKKNHIVEIEEIK